MAAPPTLETVFVDVPEHAVEAYEAAFASACKTVGFFLDEGTRIWRIEGVKPTGQKNSELATALLLAGALTGTDAPLHRGPVAADGWLARTQASFPPQPVGRRFIVHGTHLRTPVPAGRIKLIVDAGVAFGSGEHGSTRGCLRALERIAHRAPRRILDLGTGSGILAIATAKLLHRTVIASDIDPWSIRVTAENAKLNGVAANIRPQLANGWANPKLRAQGPYDLVFGNILARPLCAMAKRLASHLAPNGTAILAGLLTSQIRMVLAAHRPHGLTLHGVLHEANWATLILRKRGMKGG
ncbi:MAG: 50S ribosomal protein L11 methyltransferase [Acetobacteraceae bacterium]|nr:50S ribosomal protein L11 methyltransferase [Acetobacteraceae bacterium]MSP29071.1 50S ribosomal protein L11 methyltransferase [Acetobacteraceae bacterium]